MTESGGKFRLMTLPVLFTEKTPIVGTKGDLILADFSMYQIGLRQEMSLDKSAHVGFSRNTAHYRGILRGDGRTKHRSPITPMNGDTLSPFVVLATRA
jgi:HK97 family phage major capsid protein